MGTYNILYSAVYVSSHSTRHISPAMYRCISSTKRTNGLDGNIQYTIQYYNTIQYNFITKCQYTDCTRNVLWCQVHSSHIHSNHKTLKYNFITKCQYTDCTRNVLWCQVHSSHIHSIHKTFNTLIARGMFCGAKYAHHTYTPIIKH